MGDPQPKLPEICGRDGVVVARPQLGRGIDFHGRSETGPGEWLREIGGGFDGEIDIGSGGISSEGESKKLVRTDGYEIRDERVAIRSKRIQTECVFQNVHASIEIRVSGISCEGGVAGVGTKASLPPLFDGGKLHGEREIIERFYLTITGDEAQHVIANCGKASASLQEGGISKRDRAGTAEFAPEAGGDGGLAIIANRSREGGRRREADAGIRSSIDTGGDIDGSG